MEKNRWYIKNISFFIIIFTLFFTFFRPFLTDYFLPLPLYLQINRLLLQINFISWCLFLPAIVGVSISLPNNLTIYQPTIVVLGTLIGILLYCLFGFANIFYIPTVIINSAQLNNQNYYLVLDDFFSFENPSTEKMTLYKCDDNDKNCDEVYSKTSGSGIDDTYLSVNTFTQEIHVFYSSAAFFNLSYTYGSNSRYYDFEDITSIGNQDFSLYSYQTSAHENFVVATCNNNEVETFFCTLLPFLYSTNTFEDAELFVKDSKEIHVIIDNKLVFVHGNEPRCYAEGCILYNK
jgi:hypothetical protein